MVHPLSWKHQDRFAFASRIGALRKLDGISHGINANFLAGFAIFAVNFRLRFFAQWPTQMEQNRFRHENKQVGMRMHTEGVTAAAMATCTLRQSHFRFAQPCADHGCCQFILTQPRRPMQQPRMAFLCKQRKCLLLNPRGQVNHWVYAISTTFKTSAQTASRD